VFFPILIEDEDFIQINYHKRMVKGQKISFNILMKIVREFVKPKGMTNHFKIPYFYWKAVFHTSVCFIGT